MIEIKREESNGLTGETWRFSVFSDHSRPEVKVMLMEYVEWKRPTKRHNPSARGVWRRIMNRDNTMEDHSVPLPDDVADEALRSVLVTVST